MPFLLKSVVKHKKIYKIFTLINIIVCEYISLIFNINNNIQTFTKKNLNNSQFDS
jgi:hypothetical protein